MDTEREAAVSQEGFTLNFRFDRPSPEFESPPMDVSCYPTANLPGGAHGRVDVGSLEEPPKAPGTPPDDPHTEDTA